MSFPQPQPGMVLRYAYLWRSEALRGRDEAVKDRPCVVVIAVKREDGHTRVYVAPITHTPPGADQPAIEIPAATKKRLTLDEQPSWIITNELNSFIWAGPDIRFLDSRAPERGISYGYLPHALIQLMLAQFRTNMRSGAAKAVVRDEAP